MAALKHEPFERKFELHGIRWELIDAFSLDAMKKRDSIQVRSHSPIAPIDQVNRYVMAMQSGQDFPPVVLWGDLIIDGNTRIAAARRLGLTHFPAYRVQCKNERVAIILGAALNQINGRPLTDTEARESALLMMDDGYSDEYIAREVQIHAGKVRRWRREEDTSRRAEKLGIEDQVSKLSGNRRQKLSTVTHEAPFVELISALNEREPSGDQFNAVIDSVMKAPSDEAAVEIVRTQVEDWEPLGKFRPGKVGASTAKRANAPIASLLKNSASFYVDMTLADEQIPKWERLQDLVENVLSEYRRLAVAS